jgi:tetratricopeptide (TPR) repeat protein
MDKNELGIQMMKEGKWEEAAKTFMEAIEASPEDPIAYINFGNVLSAVGDPEKALKFFQKAIELGGGGAAYYSAGALLYENEQFDEAKTMFEQALKDGLENSDNFFMLGMCLSNLGNSRLALPYLQRSVELNQTDVEAVFQYGLCLAKEGLLDEAVHQFEQCIKLEEDHADAYYNLGVAYAYKENREKALSMLDKAIEIQPDHKLAMNTKNILENAGQNLH